MRRYLDFITLGKIVVNRLFSPVIGFYIRHFSGAVCGARARFNCMPIILLRQGGVLTIGADFSANSSVISNAVGLPHPVIIAVQGASAVLTIGDNVGISGASINCRSRIDIGNNVLIGGGAGIWDNDFHSLDPELRQGGSCKSIVARPVIIEDDVFVGARAIILKGVTIGRGAIIGAGAVVTRSVPAKHLAVGNPAVIKCLDL